MKPKEENKPPRTVNRGSWRPARTLNQRERLWGLAFVLPAVLLVAFLIYIPIGRVITMSMTGQVPLTPDREFIGLNRYADVLTSSQFWNVFQNSAVWTASVVIFQNLLGLGAAVLLNRGLPFQGLTRTVLLIPWVLPGVAAAVLWRFIYDPQLGLLNGFLQALGVVDTGVAWLGSTSTAMGAVIVSAVWKGFAFSMVIYLAALQGVNPDHLEAAMIDGAGPWQRFRFITLPSIAGLIRLNLLLTTIFTFNYFDMIWVMTRGGPLGATHIFPTFIFRLGFGELRFDDAATYGVIAAVLLAVVGYLYVRELRPQESL